MGLVVGCLSSNIYGSEQTLNDGSNVFNERGYGDGAHEQSNGQVTINNFDGGLVYKDILFDIPGRNGLDVALKLTYNPNVQHMSPNYYYLDTGNKGINYLVNGEWILSVNDVPIQVLNFETEARNADLNGDGVANTVEELSLLVNGYHASEGVSRSTPRQVRLFTSDGGYRTFVEQEWYMGGQQVFHDNPAILYATDKSKTVKALRYRNTNSTPTSYYLWVYPGNGVEIEYQRFEMTFTDENTIPQSDPNDGNFEALRPQYYLPIAIRNQVGDCITFSYTNQETNGVGRKLISAISASWNPDNPLITFNFHTPAPEGNVTIDGPELQVELIPFLSSENPYDESIMQVQQLKKTWSNGQVDRTTFEYEDLSSFASEKRTLSGINTNYDNDIDPPIPGTLGIYPMRLQAIHYPAGLQEQFTYVECNNATIDFSYDPTNGNAYYIPAFRSSLYNTYGRDPFFTNMVFTHTTVDDRDGQSIEPIQFQQFDYEFIKNGDHGYYQGEPYTHYSNSYTTTVTTKQEDTSSEGRQDKYTYKTLIVDLAIALPMPEGVTRLITYESAPYNGSGITNYPYIESYTYYWPNSTTYIFTSPPDFYLDQADIANSLLPKSKTVTENGHSVVTTYDYQYSADGYMVKTKNVVNALGFETEIKLLETFLQDPFLTDVTSVNPSSPYLDGYYYVGTALTSKTQFPATAPTQLITKTERSYYGASDSDGLLGQLKEEKVYPSVTGTPDVTTYRYYPDGSAQGAGNLYQVETPTGKLTTYSYDVNPFSMTEAYTDETEITAAYDPEEGQDRKRFPVKTVISGPKLATPLTRYAEYNLFGNTTLQVNWNGYGTRLAYGPKGRVQWVIQPYDYDPTKTFVENLNETPTLPTERYSYQDTWDNGIPPSVQHFQKQSGTAAEAQQTDYWFRGDWRLQSILKYNTATTYDQSTRSYDAFGNVVEQTDFDGHTTTFAYDYRQRQTQENPPGAGQINYTYTPTQVQNVALFQDYPWTSLANTDWLLQRTRTDENGHIVHQYTDAEQQLRARAALNEAGNPLTTFLNYDGAGNTIATQNPEGQEQTFTYDDLGRLTQSTSVDGGTKKYRYDGAGNVIFSQDANRAIGNRYGWVYHTYDAMNRRIEEGLNASYPTLSPSEEAGNLAQQRYLYDENNSSNSAGQLSLSYNTGDHTGRRYQYDARGRLAEITAYDQATGTYEQYGNVLTANMNGEGSVSKNLMIDHPQTIQIEVSEFGTGNAGVEIYDYDGQSYYLVTSFSSPGTYTCAVTQGQKIHLIAAIPYDMGNASARVRYDQLTDITGDEFALSQTYNAADAPPTLHYPNAATVNYSYTKRGQVRAIPGYLDDGTSGRGFAYTPNGQVTDLYYHSGVTQQFEYNARGWMTRDHIEPWDVYDEFDLNYEYDTTGNVTREGRHIGLYEEATYQYDALNRLDSVHYASAFSPLQNVSYTYDTNGNRTAKTIDGQTATYHYPTGMSSNRLQGVNNSTDYDYDPAGNLTIDRRKHLIYRYDWANRLNDVWALSWDHSHPAAQPGWADLDNATLHFQGDNNTGGKYAMKTLPSVSVPTKDGAELNWSFDFRRVSHIDMDRFYMFLEDSVSGNFLRFEYYDRSSDLRFTQRGKGVTEQIYEDLNANIAIGTWTQARFRVFVDGGKPAVWAYLDDKLVGKAALNSDITTFNRVRMICTEADYQIDNLSLRPASPDMGYYAETFAPQPTTGAFGSYGYNTDGQRVRQSTSGGGFWSVYWGAERRAQYHGGQLQYNYVYANGQRLVRIDKTGTPSYFHNDYLGSARRLTDANGSLIWSRDYYPFGGIRSATATGNAYQFTGKERDTQAQLDYSWHRYYDWETGRFTQVDPKWAKYPGLTPYQYAANCPLVTIDPTGNDGFRLSAGLFGVAGIFSMRFTGSVGIDFQKGIYLAGSYGLGGNNYIQGAPDGGGTLSLGYVRGTTTAGSQNSFYLFGANSIYQGSFSVPLESINKINGLLDSKHIIGALDQSTVELGVSTPTITPVIMGGGQRESVIYIIPFLQKPKSQFKKPNINDGVAAPDNTGVNSLTQNNNCEISLPPILDGQGDIMNYYINETQSY